MAGRTLAFFRRHGAAVDRSKRMKVFERENMVKKVFVLEGERVFVFGIRTELLLNTNIINTNMKGCNWSAI